MIFMLEKRKRTILLTRNITSFFVSFLVLFMTLCEEKGDGDPTKTFSYDVTQISVVVVSILMT
jgi:hypothetical protein